MFSSHVKVELNQLITELFTVIYNNASSFIGWSYLILFAQFYLSCSFVSSASRLISRTVQHKY